MNLLCTACFCVLTLSSFGKQTNSYKPNGWHDLVLDQSTSEEAVRVLGQPVNDKTDRLYIHNVDQWVTPTHKERIFRVLTYKRIGEVNKAELDFLDNKLVRIFLEYDEKKFSAKDFGARIGLDFVMVEGEVRSDSTPSMYEGQKEALVPKVYPTAYYMVCVSPQSLVSAYVLSGRGKAVFKEAFRVKTKEPFPGSLIHVEMISRRFAKG